MHRVTMMLAAIALLASPATTTSAAAQPLERYEPDSLAPRQAAGLRYPGDVATSAGNYHQRGTARVPYIERCHWTFEINALGLPHNFRQVCRRHYGEALKPQ